MDSSRSARFRKVMESLRIRNEAGQIVPMKFSDSQELIWRQVAPRLDANERLWFIVLKGRQTYTSTFFEALTFTRTISSPGTNSLVLAQDLDTSHALFSMAKLFLKYLPMPALREPRIKEITFPFPSAQSIFRVISAGVSAKGRGTTPSCVHASEVAFWSHQEVLTGLFQGLPDIADTMWVLESTANGKVGHGEMFYNEWQRAVAGESMLIPIFIPWFAMPKYIGSSVHYPLVRESEMDDEEKGLVEAFSLTMDQLAWRRYAIKTKCRGSLDLFHQEYPSCPEEAFISTGQPAFNRISLMKQQPNVCPPLSRGRVELRVDKSIKFIPDARGDVRIWVNPIPDHKYVIGADTSEGFEGKNRDASAAEVLDMETLEQVACIHGAIPPRDLAFQLNSLGRWYNNAIVAPEVNNHGHACLDHLIRTFSYPNLHLWRGRADRIKMVNARFYGWETNSFSRPLLIEAGRRAIDSNLVVLHEAKLLDELHDFSRQDNGKYEATSGHDDRVIAFLIALRSREENYFPAKKKIEMSEGEILIPTTIRVVETLDQKASTLRRISKLLKKRVDSATRSWMEM
jgi:hypothetical protein